MKTVVLDDDPTGTQSARDVVVLLAWDAAAIASELEAAEAVFLQTNSRALDAEAAVALATSIRADVVEASRALGEPVEIVLRGDSTLRGHVVAESAVFAEAAPVLFVPAFPAAGRRTRGGVHTVEIAGVEVPAAETEFARDPVFGFGTSDVAELVVGLGAPSASRVDLASLRGTKGGALLDALDAAAPGAFVVPDVADDEDLVLIAEALRRRRATGSRTVVRCAAPLAALLAGCYADALLDCLPVPSDARILVACGSHTAASTQQLEHLQGHASATMHVLDPDLVARDPAGAGREAAAAGRADLADRGLAIVASDRHRRAEHSTLADGARVMTALVTAVRDLSADSGVLVTKGGITAAELTRTALGARSARVLGPVLVGVPVWRIDADGTSQVVVIVPGNIGSPDLLSRIVDLVRG